MPDYKHDPEDEVMEKFIAFQQALEKHRDSAAIFCTLLTPRGNGSLFLCGRDGTIADMLTKAIRHNINAVRLMHHMMGVALEINDNATAADAARSTSPIIN